MAYATEGLRLCASGLDEGPNFWFYHSADVHTDVDAADYISDGSDRGLKVNDVVIVVKTTATIGATVHVVTAVTAGGAATLAPAILA